MKLKLSAQKKTVEILAPEFKDLDFTYSSNSEDGRILYLKANSKVTYGTVNYKWNFGDGLAQTGEETNVTFDSYGKKNNCSYRHNTRNRNQHNQDNDC